MIVLGLEGTAHTVSAGIIDEERILSTVSSTYVSGNGGIHPREAAVHHSDKIVPIIREALSKAGVSMNDVDLISFSRGPGLGPCLRVVGTAARSLALKFDRKIVGVNHPLGHVEIGRRLGKMSDPIVLYVSGGNTQVLAHSNGRYRVMGETMDIGLGNMLDKFARDIGIGFPGGPKIEEMARDGKKLLDLPYSVKGMDTSFSGIYTAAKAYLGKGESVEDVSYSIQETAFSMLVEVLERALYYFNKREILLAGGVAANGRLRDMLSSMAQDNGVDIYLTDRKYCMDNGAMIAQAGMLMYQNGEHHSIDETTVDQRFRIDQVETPWIRSSDDAVDRMKGAESKIFLDTYFDRGIVLKKRIQKSYRVAGMDSRLRKERTRNEAATLIRLNEAGIRVPKVYDVDGYNFEIKMEHINGVTMRSFLRSGNDGVDKVSELAGMVSRMHSMGISHGDLTTNNIIVSDSVYLIDTSLSRLSTGDEDLATDLFLLFESFKSNHSDRPELPKHFWENYKKSFPDYQRVSDVLEAIEKRRRYV